MARQTQRLSVKSIAAKKKAGYYADGAGLYLQVGLTGTKSWIFRYMLNGKAREMGLDLSRPAGDLMPELAQLGGRLRPLKVGTLDLGEAMFIESKEGASTLAEKEKEAIVQALDAHAWRLAETAKSLGISRTTLWRRLRAYGLHRDGRSKWAQAS